MILNGPGETPVENLTQLEAQKLFRAVFDGHQGQKALLYILVKVGGVGKLRFNADAQSRLILDGKQEAALEIMHLAGFSPFHLAERLMAIPSVTERSGNETLPVQDAPARARRRSRRAPAPVAASAVSDADAFAGDTATEPDTNASANAGDAEGILE